jgi:FkbM family methyltransferase
MRTVFDVGVYDGADTGYYLDEGFRVVAVEANPEMARFVSQRFFRQVESGQLEVMNAAISDHDGPVDFFLAGDDPGASSTVRQMVESRAPLHTIRVPTTTIPALLGRFGVPFFLKSDIEGSDHLCILPLTKDTRPEYVSFEAGERNPAQYEPLIEHLAGIGFRRFKLINQVSFLELTEQRRPLDRAVLGVRRRLGYDPPRRVRRSGRRFTAGHSSGPGPWSSSGRWVDADTLLTTWRRAHERGELTGWYDVHAG